MEKKKNTPEQRNTVFVAVITSFITTFMGSALNLAVPNIESEFGVSAADVGWVITVYMLTCAALAVPFGRLADLFDRKKILWMGILIFTLASAASPLSSGMVMLLVFRFCQGVGASMVFSTNIAILVAAFDGSKRGQVVGYSTSATYVGLSAGPVLGGILTHNLGWKSVFLAAAAVSAVAFYSALKKLPQQTNEKKADISFDYKGNVLYVSAIVALMYGLSVIKTSRMGAFIMAAGVLLLIIFVHVELKEENPVINIDMFRSNKAYTFSNMAAMLNYGATFAISYLISIYLQVIMGYTSQHAGMILIVSPVIQAVLSPPMGKLSDRYSPYAMSSAGMGLCAAALALFAFMPEESSLARIILTLSISGVGFALFSSPNTNAVMASVEKENYSVATSILATMRSIGHTTSMAIVTLVVGMYMGSLSLAEADPQTLMTTMHTCFFVFTGLCAAGIFIALRRKA